MTKMPFLTRGVAAGVSAVAVMAALAMPVEADEAKAAAKKGDVDSVLTLTSENDKYFGNSDRHYTNGARVKYSAEADEAPSVVKSLQDTLPFLKTGERTGYTLGFNHTIFTPDDVTRVAPATGDMPYAGFAALTAGYSAINPGQVDEYELTAGIVGPSAQGEYVQRAVHDVLDIYKPQGWNTYQLSDEPILNVSWLRRHPETVFTNYNVFGDKWFANIEPRYGFALGNAYTYATAGGTLKFGPEDARNGDTIGLIVPGMPGSGMFARPADGFSWYGFVSLDGRLVGRNIFLDGNTFRDGPHVEKNPLVFDGAIGVALLTGPLKTTVALNQRTREFESQGASDVFGSLSMGYRF